MMNRHINYRFLVLLLVGLTAGTAIVFGVHAAQVHRQARLLRAQAETAESEGRLADSMRALQRYLAFAPEDNAARAHYGELVEQLADAAPQRWRAVTVYQQVLDREPSRQDTRYRLARLTLALGWSSEARAHLEILIREQPERGELYALLAQCQEQAREYSQAASSYEKALRHEGGRVEASIRLALLLQDRLDQPERAAQVLDELVRTNDRCPEAYLARALQRLDRGRLEESAGDLERARQLAGNDPRILLALADLERRRGRWDEAERRLREARDHEPKNLAVHLALATLERQRHRPGAAVACLREGLKLLPDQPDLLLLLGESLLEQGEESATAQVIERLRRPGMPPGLVPYLTGCLQLHRRQWQQAIHTLEEVTQSPDTDLLLAGRAFVVLGRCHEQLADRIRQLAALRKAVELDRSSVPARLTLAAALQRTGHLEEALEQYRQIVPMAQAPEESRLLLAQLLVQRNRSLPVRNRQWSEVEKVLERAVPSPSLEVPFAVLRAEVLLEQGRTEPARALLEKTSAAHPKAVEPWTALADLALRQGEPDRAQRILDQAQKQLGDRRELYEPQIVLALRRSPRKAEAILERLEKQSISLPSGERFALLGQLATAYLRLGEVEEGRRVCRLLAEQAPADLPARLAVLDLAVQAGEDALLTRIAADVRRLEGEDGVWWRYGEAAGWLRKAQRGEPDAGLALDRLRAMTAEIVRRRPDWPRGALLEASLHELDGDLTRSATAYLRAFRGGERLPGLAERLTELLVEQGRLDEADEVIRRFEQQARPSPSLARLGAEIALRLSNKERARDLARLAVSKETNDYQQLIWLGQMLGQTDRPAEGEEMLRRAVKGRGDLAETWLALLAHLVRFEHESEADEVREEMRRRLSAEQAPLALAIADETLAEWDRAAEQYRQALTRSPDDAVILQRAASFYVRLNCAEQAERLLRRLLALRANVSELSQAWARRELALLLAYAGGDDNYREALALLPRQGPSETSSLLDQRARLLVEGTQAAARREALRQLEESGKRQPFLPEELFCLVRLYEADGNARAARERMLDLLAVDSRNPQYLAHHIARLLQQGRTDEARPWIARLRQVEPDSSRIKAFQQATLSGQRSAKPPAER